MFTHICIHRNSLMHNKVKNKKQKMIPQGDLEVRCSVYSYANYSPHQSPHKKWILCTWLLNNELSLSSCFLHYVQFILICTVFVSFSSYSLLYSTLSVLCHIIFGPSPLYVSGYWYFFFNLDFTMSLSSCNACMFPFSA